MNVTLLHNTPLSVCSHAIRTCWSSYDKSDNGGKKDRELIYRVGNKYKHASTLEHLVYTFYIQGISRAVLQELARHRIASLSVKSSRYTLKELKHEEPFLVEDEEMPEYSYYDKDRASNYLVFTGKELVDAMSMDALENLRKVLVSGISNDYAKYAMPEAYKTELTWTINARNLQNFLQLRTNKAALWEIRELARRVYQAIPAEHTYLFNEYITQEGE